MRSRSASLTDAKGHGCATVRDVPQVWWMCANMGGPLENAYDKVLRRGASLENNCHGLKDQ